MRIVDLTTFLAMPVGTFYQKFHPNYFEHLAIFEGRVGDRDFISDDAIHLPIPHELVDQMLDLGETCTVEFQNTGRDGCFDDKQLFAVWEADDLQALKTAVERALSLH